MNDVPLDHPIVGSVATQDGRWAISCRCGRSFHADEKQMAYAAHQHHFDMAQAKAAAKTGIPAAREALRKSKGGT